MAQLNSGGALLWNTFLGGDYNDYGHAIAADDANIYVAGESDVTYGDWGTPVNRGSTSCDAFVVRLAMEPPERHYVYLPSIPRNR